jgi:hypothetical protein
LQAGQPDKDESSDVSAFGFEAQIKALKAENEQAESQCQVLTQQLERLKEILNRLTKSK